MGLDKKLYREAHEALRKWSEATERSPDGGHLEPAEAWRRYAALVEFSWQLSPQPSQRQRAEKARALDRYYARVRTLEDWRQRRGKQT